MPRPLLIALVAFVASANLFGQEAKKPSPAVTRILEEAVRAVKKNRVEFDKANQKPLGEARKALEELSTKLIKDGKADEAGAVLKQVGTLEVDVMRLANAPAPMAGGAVPQRPLLERMAGRWTHPNSTGLLAFEENGKVTSFWKSGAVNTDGTARPLSEDEVEVRYSNQSLHRYRMIDADLIVERLFNPDGSEKGEGYLKMRAK